LVVILLLLFSANVFAFDHTYADYQSVLDKYVADGRVDYTGLLADRGALDEFVASCEAVSFERYNAFTKNEKLAFLINLYNAATLQLVLNHWPVESIKDIGGLFSSPWNKKFLRLFEHDASLGMIEHDILRADFSEPRIHFAIVCASVGCPMLRSDVYLDSEMSRQLAEQERHFLTQRANDNRFEDGTLYVSPIFKWYRRDFDGDDGVRTLFQMYFPDVKKDTRIRYTEYDWGLNQKP